MGRYLPAPKVVEFHNAKMRAENFTVLGSLVKASSLFELVRSTLQIHGEVHVDEMIDTLSMLSGESTRSRARRSLEWLERTDFVSVAADGGVQLLGS